MQYLNDNLNMHIVCEGKMQYSHYDLNPYLCMGNENAILARQFKHAHYMWVQNAICALWPYIHTIYGRPKCKTHMSNMEHSWWNFMTALNPSKKNDLPKLGTKQQKNKMIKKKIIPLMFKNDVMFKKVVV